MDPEAQSFAQELLTEAQLPNRSNTPGGGSSVVAMREHCATGE